MTVAELADGRFASALWRRSSRPVLPGFGLTVGFTAFTVSVIVVVPLMTLFTKTGAFSPAGLAAAMLSPRVVSAFRLSIGASLIAVAAVTGVPAVELGRRNFVPVMSGLIAATIVAVILM